MAYKLIEEIFELNNAMSSTAEAHGLATGMLCLDSTADSRIWLQETFEEVSDINDEHKSIMLSLLNQTRELLDNPDFEYALFLPHDDCPLYIQA